MAYDTKLAQRIRRMLADQPRLTEREMFGGIGFMIRDNIACGVIGEDMMVRVGPAHHEPALKETHVRPFDITGKPSKGWVVVAAPALASGAALKKWVKRGVEFALTLPAK